MSDYLKEGFIDEVKGCLGGRGGQENVIESIKVNGVGQTVDENKAVNIPVPTKTSDLDNDSGYQTNSEVSSTVAAEVAKIVADAPEDFDTLKEMSDWISQHEDSAAAMNSAISKNKEDISSLYTSKADVSDVQTVEASVDELNNNLVQLEFGEVAGGKNLFDKNSSENVDGWLINGIPNGENTYNQKTSHFIRIDGNTFVYNKGNANNQIAFYDSNRAFINQIHQNDGINVVEIPTNAKYVRVVYFDGEKDLVQIEVGTTATTPYEPYIPSVKMLASEVSAQNDSLDSQGLLNKFDGKLEQGYKNASGTIIYDSTNVCIKNTISVSSGDKVTVKLDSVATKLYTVYRNNGVFVSQELTNNTNNVTVTIPSGANGLDITMVYNSATTPSQVGNVYIYINNAIDQLKNDLDIYKPKQYYGKSVTIEESGMYLITATAMGYGVIACTYIVYKNSSDIYHIEKVSGINLTLSASGNVITPSYTENSIYFYVQRIANFWS